MSVVKDIRKQWLEVITDNESYEPIYSNDGSQTFIGLAFYKKTENQKNNVLLVLANGNPYHEAYSKPSIHRIRELSKNNEKIGKLLFSTHEGPRPFIQFIDFNTLDIHLGPGEVKIISF